MRFPSAVFLALALAFPLRLEAKAKKAPVRAPSTAAAPAESVTVPVEPVALVPDGGPAGQDPTGTERYTVIVKGVDLVFVSVGRKRWEVGDNVCLREAVSGESCGPVVESRSAGVTVKIPGIGGRLGPGRYVVVTADRGYRQPTPRDDGAFTQSDIGSVRRFHLALVPRVWGFSRQAVDVQSGGTAHARSTLSLGLGVTVGAYVEDYWEPFVYLRESTFWLASDAGRPVGNPSMTLFGVGAGIALYPLGSSRWRLAVGGGFEHYSLLRASSMTELTQDRIGTFGFLFQTRLELYRERPWRVALEGGLALALGRSEATYTFDGGLRYSGKLSLGREIDSVQAIVSVLFEGETVRASIARHDQQAFGGEVGLRVDL